MLLQPGAVSEFLIGTDKKNLYVNVYGFRTHSRDDTAIPDSCTVLRSPVIRKLVTMKHRYERNDQLNATRRFS